MRQQPSAERPIVAGATREKATSRTTDISQSARAPTKGNEETTASTSALSTTTLLTRTSRHDARWTVLSSLMPPATSPAAIPAIVPSRKVGKTLLVPVEMGTQR